MGGNLEAKSQNVADFSKLQSHDGRHDPNALPVTERGEMTDVICMMGYPPSNWRSDSSFFSLLYWRLWLAMSWCALPLQGGRHISAGWHSCFDFCCLASFLRPITPASLTPEIDTMYKYNTIKRKGRWLEFACELSRKCGTFLSYQSVRKFSHLLKSLYWFVSLTCAKIF